MITNNNHFPSPIDRNQQFSRERFSGFINDN